MKTLKMKDIKSKLPADLQKMLVEKRETLRLSRFGSAGAKSKNVKEVRTIRKSIAQILTVLNA